MSGKGDTPRPVDRKKWAENYDRIFRKHHPEEKPQKFGGLTICPKCYRPAWEGHKCRDIQLDSLPEPYNIPYNDGAICISKKEVDSDDD